MKVRECPQVYQYNYNGDLVRRVELPGIGTSSGFYGERDQEELYFSFSNYYTPGNLYSFNPTNGEYDIYWKLKFNIKLKFPINIIFTIGRVERIQVSRSIIIRK